MGVGSLLLIFGNCAGRGYLGGLAVSGGAGFPAPVFTDPVRRERLFLAVPPVPEL